MSYIQKTIYALFLLALFSGCTDEVLDGGGNGSTPIEEGKLVDVKFVLDQAGEETVLTKGWDSDHGPEVDELLFLQYKGENLVYAWYTDEEKDFLPTTKSDYDFEGWGAKSRVINVKLLSGKDYQVYVVANVDLDDDDSEYIEEDDDRGPVNLKNKNINSEFGTLDKLKAWTRNNSNLLDDDDKEDNEEKKYSYPDDEDIMFGIASNISENGLANKKNYDYTKMATNFSDGYISINDDSNNSYLVSIEEGSFICATLYPPYSKVTLTIEKDNSFNADLTISSVKLFNRPKDYSLFSGYSLSGEGRDDSGKSLFEIETKGKSINELSGQSSKTIILYENMAGTVSDKMNPFGESIELEQPGYPYTYIEVKGYYKNKGNNSEGNVVYRFILGKDAQKDCNVERNVHYMVKMKLLNDGGVNKPSWSVNYDGKKPEPEPEPETPEVDDHDVLSRLDAHASVKEFTIRNLKRGAYYYIVVNKNANECKIDENASINVDPIGSYTYNQSAGGFNSVIEYGTLVSMYKGGGDEFYKIAIDRDGNYTFKYRQLSWFDYGMVNKQLPITGNQYNIKDPITVAGAKPNTYYLHIFEGDESNIGNKVATLTVTQYPPVVVTKLTGASDTNGFSKYTFISSSPYAYMERFDDDHSTLSQGDDWTNDEQLGSGWTIIDDNTKEYKDYMFDYSDHSIFGNYMKSDYCYWVNLHGRFGLSNDLNYLRNDEDWPYIVNCNNVSNRYIIPWRSNN